jgi:DNA-binding response OmpR family regulator
MDVLVIEDDPVVGKSLKQGFLEAGYGCTWVKDGKRGLEEALARQADVIVLDLMLPGIDGVEACRRIRTFSDAYIIMLTAKSDEVDKLIGLSVGADDYLTKPFSPRELVARVRAMLRRPRAVPDPGIRRFGELEVDPVGREVRAGGDPIDLTRTEFDLLDTLSAQPRVAFSRRQLLERVWSGDWYGDDHVIDVHIGNLRHKLGDDATAPRYIRTVRGVGYRMGTG